MCHRNRVQTSTHRLTIGGREVRKEFVADHDVQAEREWACLTLLAEHAPGLAPRPLRREDGETPVIVMERLPGSHLAPRPLTADQTTASWPDSTSASAWTSASSTEETTAVAPVASMSATCSGLRTTEVTS